MESLESKHRTTEMLKLLQEENAELKSYVHHINLECLDLHATLFEEANKSIIQAQRKQLIAERKFREIFDQNEILLTQLKIMKTFVSKVNSQMFCAEHAPSILSDSTNFIFDNVATDKRKRGSMFFKSSQPKNVCFVNNFHQCRNQTSTCRKRDLLNVLLQSSLPKSHLEEMDMYAYELYLKWIEADCPLNMPNSMYWDTSSVNHNISRYETKRMIRIIRDNRFSSASGRRANAVRPIHQQSDDQPPTENDSDSDIDNESSAPTKTSSPRLGLDTSIVYRTHHSHSLDSSQTCHIFSSASTVPRKDENAFVELLYQCDLKPCLNFSNKLLTQLIYRALPVMGLEIVVLTKADQLADDCDCRTDDNSRYRSSDSGISNADDSDSAPVEYCLLMPTYKVGYQLSIKFIWKGQEGADDVKFNISAEARNRIVAAVNLFQYLNYIKRGLVSSPKSSSPIHSTTLSDTTLDGNFSKNQFAAIQRHRLMISFARLGYGLPDNE